MKIARLETFVLHVPVTNRKIADSTHAITHWGMPGVRVYAEDGTVGTGYTGTHAVLSLDRLITDCIEGTFADLVVGRDVLAAEAINEDLQRHPPALWVGRGGIVTLAIAALDMALWDLKARILGQPLWKLLGGDDGKRLEAYNTDGGWLNWSEEELVADSRRLTEEAGFRGIKIKLGKESAVEDLRRVELVRKAIGPDVKLMVDANGRWDFAHASRVGRRLADFDVVWFEEPMWHDDVIGHARLAEAIETPIALGELLYTVDSFRHFVEAGAVHFIQVDVTRIGGVTPWWKVADLGYTSRVPVVPHHGDGGQAQIHLGIAHAGCRLFEYIPWTRDCFIEPMTVEDGFYEIPREPGAGTRFRDEAFKRFRVA